MGDRKFVTGVSTLLNVGWSGWRCWDSSDFQIGNSNRMWRSADWTQKFQIPSSLQQERAIKHPGKGKPAIHFIVMWLQGTVHINKCVSLLCICLYIPHDGFTKKEAMHFLWQSCQTPSRNKKQYITCLLIFRSKLHFKILSFLINRKICMWRADRLLWDMLTSNTD